MPWWWTTIIVLALLYVSSLPLIGIITSFVTYWHFVTGRRAVKVVFHQLLPSSGKKARAALLVSELVARVAQSRLIYIVGGHSYGSGYKPEDGEAEFTPDVHAGYLVHKFDVAKTRIRVFKEGIRDWWRPVDSTTEVIFMFKIAQRISKERIIDIELVGLPTHVWRLCFLYFVHNIFSSEKYRIVSIQYISPFAMGARWLVAEPVRFAINFIDPLGIWAARWAIINRRRASTKSLW